jgi:hypothetical protein
MTVVPGQDNPEENKTQVVEYPDYKWIVEHLDTDQGGQYHAVPENDTTPHIRSSNCACDPQFLGLRESNGGQWYPLFLHHSYDMRELDEWWFYNIQHPELGYTDKDIK